MSVSIVSYGMGNLRSIYNACKAVGADPVIAENHQQLADASAIILPGVGAFGEGMELLSRSDWIAPLRAEVLEKGKPFLGICLGMQLLGDFSTEHGRHEGLGWLPGSVTRLDVEEQGLRLPHVGWNEVTIENASVLYAGMDRREDFYFVHSYGFHPSDKTDITSQCKYGTAITASVARGNIMATQFHPEKSHHKGLKVLKNFVEMKS